MAYTPHYLLSFGGYLGDSQNEIWSCGIRMHSEQYTGFDEVGWFNGVGQTAPKDWFQRATSHISAVAKLAWVKFNKIDAAGHYEEPTTREFVYSPVVAGGSSAINVLPYQCSLVLSWRTNERTRGPASKGRIYSPAPQVTMVGNTGLFQAAQALEAATSAALFLNTLDAGFDLTNTIRPHIMSTIDGMASEINSVWVDNRIDVQRRRANALAPATSKVPVTY